MNIVMFIIFLLMDLGMIGIFAFVYSGKEEYSEGMILGVHIPQSEINHEEVKALCLKYKKSLKQFNLWNLLLGTIICLLCFWSLTYFMIIWMIWLFVYLGTGIGLIYVLHRKMYDIKMKYNWIMEGSTHIVHVDTKVSAIASKLPISHWCNFPVVILIGISLFLPSMKEYFGASILKWIFPGTILVVTFLFWGLHLWYIHRKNIVYSEDSEINLSMNRMEKRTWSVIMLSANYFNLLSWAYLTVQIVLKQWLYDADYWIYIGLQMLPVIVIIAGVSYMQKRRKNILTADSKAIVVDDDEYWKNGWYYNPNDKHLFVADRLCSTNYSLNMAKPAAKKLAVGTAVFLAVIIVGVFGLILAFDNAKITLLMEDNNVTLKAVLYHTSFVKDDIQSLKLLDHMPEDDFTRTNGGATEKYLIGHFEGKQTGKCMMYIYRDYFPILEIKLKDTTVYVNSKNENEVQEWYEKLLN